MQKAYLYYLQRMPSLVQGGLFDGLPNEMLHKLIRSSFHREIQAINLFRKCDFQLLADIIVHGRPYRAEEGEVIYEMGDIADEITFIIRGSVGISVFGLGGVGGKCYPISGHDVEVGTNSAFRTLLGSSTAGGYFGDLECRKQSTRLARYHALETSTFLAIKYVKIREAVERNPIAGAALLEELKSRYDVFETVSRECMTSSTRYPPKPQSIPHSSADRFPTYLRDKTIHERKDSSTNQNESGQEKKSECEWVPTHRDSPLWVDGKIETPKEAEGRKTSLDSNGQRRGMPSYLTVVLNRYGAEVLGEHTIHSLKSLYLFHPRDSFKIAWDVLVGGLTVYSLLTIPIQIAFYSATSTENGRNTMTFEYVVDLFFFSDMLCSFNTAFFSDNDDAYIAVRARIVDTYLRSWFLVDLLSCIPFDLLLLLMIDSSSTNLRLIQLVRIARLLRFVKLLRIVNFIKLFYRLEDLLNISPAFLGLCATLIKVVFIAHLVCCMWWGISTNLSTQAWYDNVDMVYVPLSDAPFKDQYVASLYWTITTLSTVGYGDIVPIGNEERIVTIFVMVLGATVFGYVVANVGTIVGTINQLEARAADRLTHMTEFMKEKNCSKAVVNEIINHFKHVYKHHSSFDEETILSRLPVRLRIELTYVQQKKILEKIPLFRYIKNTSLKLFLLHSMTSHFAGVERCILREGDEANQIIFLINGKCSICKILNLPLMDSEDVMSPLLKSQSRRERVVSSVSRKNTSVNSPIWGRHVRNKPFPRSPQRTRSTKRVISTHNLLAGQVEHCSTNILPGNSSIRMRNGSRGSFKSSFDSNEYPSMRLNLSNILQSKKRKSRVTHNQDAAATTRARANWMKVKALLPKIAAIQHIREDSVIDGYDMAQATRKIESMHVLMQVGGHLERVLCDVRPLGFVARGDFLGHTAMMDQRAYAASVVVSEPCHYYSLHRSDVLTLVREQPEIALELQSALSMAICEDNKRSETDRRKKLVKWFLDDVKKRFESREAALMTKRRKPFSKMILSLAVTAREKDTEKEEIKTRDTGNKDEDDKASAMDGGWKWFNKGHEKGRGKGHEKGRDKAREEKGGSETVESLRAALKRGSEGISSTLKSGRLAAAGVFDTGRTVRKRRSLSIFKIRDTESQSQKSPKSNTFWQGMVDLETGARSAKIELAWKLNRLDKLQKNFLARVDEGSSDGDEDYKMCKGGRSSRNLDQSGRGSECEYGKRMRYLSWNNSMLCRRKSTAAASKSTSPIYTPTAEEGTPLTAMAQHIKQASLLPLPGTLLPLITPAELMTDFNQQTDRHASSTGTEYCPDTGCTFSPSTPHTVATPSGETPTSKPCEETMFHFHGFSSDTVDNGGNCLENTEIDYTTAKKGGSMIVSSSSIESYLKVKNNSNSNSNSSNGVLEANNLHHESASNGNTDLDITTHNTLVESDNNRGERNSREINCNTNSLECNTCRKIENQVSREKSNNNIKAKICDNSNNSNNNNNYSSNTNNISISEKIKNTNQNLNSSYHNKSPFSKSMSDKIVFKSTYIGGIHSPHSNPRLFVSVPPARDSISASRSFSSYIHMQPSRLLSSRLLSSRLLSSMRLTKIRVKKKGLKRHRSSSDLLDVRDRPCFPTQGSNHPSSVQFKCGSYVKCDSGSGSGTGSGSGSGSFFAPPSRMAAMRRRKSFPSKDIDFWGKEIVKKHLI
jgi:CRP-like cAMP-binding protein